MACPYLGKFRITASYPHPGQEPLRVCDICGQEASDVCSQCIFENKGWFCEEHAEGHECGEDMLLPAVNSPRVGMCAYTG